MIDLSINNVAAIFMLFPLVILGVIALFGGSAPRMPRMPQINLPPAPQFRAPQMPNIQVPQFFGGGQQGNPIINAQNTQQTAKWTAKYGTSPSYHTLFHGCPGINEGLSIFTKGLWIIGNSYPPAVWLTDDFSYASQMGFMIVIVRADVTLPYETHNGHPHVLPVPNGQAGKKCRLVGVHPVDVVDTNMNSQLPMHGLIHRCVN